MTEKTIWIIDDDPIYQSIMKKIILKSELFSSILSFTNGKKAIKALKNSIENQIDFPNIILLDIEMPVLDGWEFMEEVKLLDPQIINKIKIYISSSSIALEDRERAKNTPIILGYLCKPISLEDIKKITNT